MENRNRLPIFLMRLLFTINATFDDPDLDYDFILFH